MPVRNDMQIKIEDAPLIFLNFAGIEKPFNKEGSRNFCVVLDPALAEQMAIDGWNVKLLVSKEDPEQPPTPYLPIEVKYKVKPPRITMITSTGRTPIGEHNVEVLDYADIAKADLIATAYNWEVGAKTGVKAYLKTLFVTINEDELELKYGVNNVGEVVE